MELCPGDYKNFPLFLLEKGYFININGIIPALCVLEMNLLNITQENLGIIDIASMEKA